MAASAGDGAAALAAAQGMRAAGVAPRLRSFTPALLAFSTAGQVCGPVLHATDILPLHTSF